MFSIPRRLLVISLVLSGALLLSASAAMANPSPMLANQSVSVNGAQVLATDEPFVEIEPAEVEEEVPQWTYRYLIPTAVALTIAMIAGTVVMYFVRVVRGRYTVAE